VGSPLLSNLILFRGEGDRRRGQARAGAGDLRLFGRVDGQLVALHGLCLVCKIFQNSHFISIF
jgi:hypothetical protein